MALTVKSRRAKVFFNVIAFERGEIQLEFTIRKDDSGDQVNIIQRYVLPCKESAIRALFQARPLPPQYRCRVSSSKSVSRTKSADDEARCFSGQKAADLVRSRAASGL